MLLRRSRFLAVYVGLVLFISVISISLYRSSHKPEIVDLNSMIDLKNSLFTDNNDDTTNKNSVVNDNGNVEDTSQRVNSEITQPESDQYKKQVEVEQFLDETLNIAEDEEDTEKIKLKEDISKMTDEEIREQLSVIKEQQLEKERSQKAQNPDNTHRLSFNAPEEVQGTLINNTDFTRKDVPPDNQPWAQYEIERIIPDDYDYKIKRENATLFTLCRNSELYEILDSIQQLENRFNRNFQYDWVFLNDEPFTEEFISLTSNMINGRARYGLIPKKHWSYPPYIDQEKAREIRESRKWSMITYGSSESYRHMCRFNSLYFYKHPIMEEYQYYWRVEPHVKFACDIIEDPFTFLRVNNKKYGFTISMKELPNTIETLWKTTKLYFQKLEKNYFSSSNDDGIENDNLLKFISDDGGESYNLCHYWTNFEIANLDIYRNDIYEGYVDHLDHSGGFFYERWGDAPIHSIIFSLVLKREEIFMFQDISYEHTVAKTCPLNFEFRKKARCVCDPTDNWVLKSESSCNLKFLEVGAVEKPAELEAILKSINDKKAADETLRVQQRKLRMETARRQADARRKKAEERRKSRLEAQQAKKAKQQASE